MSRFINPRRRLRWAVSRGGFLLMEVLLVVVVLSVCLTIIIQSMSMSRQASVYSRDYTIALLLLDTKMFELLQQRAVESALMEEGAFEEPYADYQFEIQARNWETEEGPKDLLNEVKITIFWSRGEKQKKISATTLLLNKDKLKS